MLSLFICKWCTHFFGEFACKEFLIAKSNVLVRPTLLYPFIFAEITLKDKFKKHRDRRWCKIIIIIIIIIMMMMMIIMG